MIFTLKIDKIIDAIFATDTSIIYSKNRQIIDPIPQTPVPVAQGLIHCVCCTQPALPAQGSPRRISADPLQKWH